MLEDQYSKTPFINYYLFLENDDEAKEFEDDMREFFLSESEYQLFQHLRRWNKRYPDKKIQIGYYDIEHDYPLTIQKIFSTNTRKTQKVIDIVSNFRY